MAKGSKKPVEEETPAEPGPPEQPGWGFVRSLFRPGPLVGIALLVCVVVFGRQWLSELPDLAKRPEYRIGAADVRVTPPPRWVPSDFVTHTLEDAGLPREMSLLENDLAARIADAFRRDPWVERVVQVKKSAADGVVVDLQYRQPVAMIEVPEGFYPVDVNGVLLPPADISPGDARRFPLIQNVTSRPAGRAGNSWGDDRVLGAARLAQALQTAGSGRESPWERYQLRAIRLARGGSSRVSLEETTLELATTGGSRILWGRPPGTNHPGELTVEQKLGRLERYVADYGGFDQPHGPYEIDIRHWQEISRRSLASVPGRTRR